MIETSGLADPAPILHVLMTDPGLVTRLAIGRTVALVDAPTGPETLARHPEARKQVAMADRLLLTKAAVAPDRPGPLTAAGRALNPPAEPAECPHSRTKPPPLT